MKKSLLVAVALLLFAIPAKVSQGQIVTPLQYGGFEQWTSHPGYSVTVLIFPLSVYSSYSTPTGWNYLAYPVNESVTYSGITVNVNTDLPLIKCSQVTSGAPEGSKALRLQTFKASDIISSTVYSLAASSLDTQLTNMVVPAALFTAEANLTNMMTLIPTLESGISNPMSMLSMLSTLDVNDYLTGGIAVDSLVPDRLTGYYKFTSAQGGDNGGVLLIGTRYNTTTHRRQVVGGGINLGLTDTSVFTPFSVDYVSLNTLDPSFPVLEPDSMIVVLASSANLDNRQQGSQLYLDALQWETDVPDTFSVAVMSSDTLLGSAWMTLPGDTAVFDRDSLIDNSVVLLHAAPAASYMEGYYPPYFVSWNDGNTDNPRTLVLTQDTLFTALFAADTIPLVDTFSVAVMSSDTMMGSAWMTLAGDTATFVSGDYADSTVLLLYAAPAASYLEGFNPPYFVGWSDGNTDNPRTLVLTQDTLITALFAADSMLVVDTFSIEVGSDNLLMGSVWMTLAGSDETFVSGSFASATELLLYAVPAENFMEGYHSPYFVSWNDGSTDNPRTVVLTQDTLFTALFAADQVEGISDVLARSVRVYPTMAQDEVTVELSMAAELRLFDLQGRLVDKYTAAEGRHTLPLPRAGVYVLQAVTAEGCASQRIVNR